MRRIFIPLSLCVLGLSTLMLVSCHHDNNANTNVPGADTAKSADKTKTAEADADSESFLLPSPLQIASIFKNAGLVYFPGLTSPVKDASKYNSNFEAAINMGIFSADLSYCILNKQTQESLDYMKTVKALSEKLGFGSVFQTNSLMNRFQNNMGNTDSLASVIADLQMQTDTYLEQNKQKYIGVIAFSGAWIESMYIGSKVYEKGKSSNVSSRISEQMNILDNMIKLLNKYQAADTHLSGLAKDLQSIQNEYSGYSEVKNYNPDSDQPIVLSPEHIAQISSLVQDLRAKYISAS